MFDGHVDSTKFVEIIFVDEQHLLSRFGIEYTTIYL